MFARTLTSGRTSAGKEHLLDQVAAGNQRAGGLGQRGRKPRPRQDADEHEQRVRFGFLRMEIRQDDGEDERVDRQQQQRVDERPDEAEHAAAVARLQLSCDEALDQPAVADQVGEVRKHLRANSSAGGHLEADQRLQHGDSRPLEIHLHGRRRSVVLRLAFWRLPRGRCRYRPPSRRFARGS